MPDRARCSALASKGLALGSSGPGRYLPIPDGIPNLLKSATARHFSLPRRYQLLPLHSMVAPAEQRRVFVRPLAGVRKIVLATNIGELPQKSPGGAGLRMPACSWAVALFPTVSFAPLIVAPAYHLSTLSACPHHGPMQLRPPSPSMTWCAW